MQTTSQLKEILGYQHRTEFLLTTLEAESFTIEGNGEMLLLHFSEPAGSLQLTTQELRAMNHPAFLAGFQMNRPSKQGILAAIKFQFGKAISKPLNLKMLDQESSMVTSSF